MSAERLVTLTKRSLVEAGVERRARDTTLTMVERTGIPVVGLAKNGKGHTVVVRLADWQLWKIRRNAPEAGTEETPACRSHMANVLRRLERLEELLEMLLVEWKGGAA